MPEVRIRYLPTVTAGMIESLSAVLQEIIFQELRLADPARQVKPGDVNLEFSRVGPADKQARPIIMRIQTGGSSLRKEHERQTGEAIRADIVTAIPAFPFPVAVQIIWLDAVFCG
jgi:hypothetical protein